MTDKIDVTIEPNDSQKMKRNKQAVAKLREFQTLVELKKEKGELESLLMPIKFNVADEKFKMTMTHENGKLYRLPRFSCVQEKAGKPFLRVLLTERSKKAEWLKLSKDDQKEDNWIDLIKIKNTGAELLGGNSALEKLLMANNLMIESEAVPISNQTLAKESNPLKTD